MIAPDYVRTMARYNAWQNAEIFRAADGLEDAARRRDRGAFFGSIHKTLNHLLWGDQIWMHRFSGSPAPVSGSIAGSVDQFADWPALKDAREAFDRVICDWADALDPAWLDGTMVWFSVAANRELSASHALLVTHMFNHQTHHRGQVNAMLTAAGATVGDTDLMLLDMQGK